MDQAQITTALTPHARRPIRAFLADPTVSGTEIERAFWAAIYKAVRCVDHTEAKRIAEALENSPERVERVIDGWRP